MSDMEFMIHVLKNFPEEYDAVLESLESCLVLTEKEGLILETIGEKFNSRFDKIDSMEREKDCNEKPLALGFNVHFKGTCHQCCKNGHKSDSPKYPDNQETDENKNPSGRSSKSDMNVVRCSNT